VSEHKSPHKPEIITNPQGELRALVGKDLLTGMSPSQKAIVIKRFQSIQDIPRLIGKDFDMPIHLGKPGGGWYWNYKENYVVVDSADLLDRPIDECRFIIAHEGSHRRISLADTESAQNKPFFEESGFGFIYNALEDPRVNNYLVDKYPTFKTGMEPLYEKEHGFEAESKKMSQQSVGFQPRIMQVGFEFIRHWVAESRGESVEIRDDLDPEVIEALEKTLASARLSWRYYPSWEESQSEDTVIAYAQASLDIIETEIWPHLSELIKKDLQDAAASEMLRNAIEELISGIGDPESLKDLPEDLKDSLINQLEEIITSDRDMAKENLQLDEIDPKTLDELREYINDLPEDVKKKLFDQAKDELDELEERVGEMLKGKLSESQSDNSQDSKDNESQDLAESKSGEDSDSKPGSTPPEFMTIEDVEYESGSPEVYADQGTLEYYQELRKQLEPVINELFNKLNHIFIARESKRSQSGFSTGKSISVHARIKEKASGISATESKAWERLDLPTEKDYAFSLLIDLSGSMSKEDRRNGGETRIRSALKTAIVWSEVLGRLGIKFEVVGFNTFLHIFKEFRDQFGKETRLKLSPMEGEVNESAAIYNDDGWALSKASERMQTQRAKEKFIVVISDGYPVPSYSHSGPEFDLGTVVREISENTDQHVIGIGVQSDAVTNYYPESVVIEDISQLPRMISIIISQSIERGV